MNAFWSNWVSGRSSPEPPSPRILSARSSRRKSSIPNPAKPDFSYNGLQALLDELVTITGGTENPSQIVNTSPDHLVELIRLIAETLLWGEQNQSDSLMFDQFCERGIMKVFVNLLNSPSIITSSSGLSIFTSSASVQTAQITSNRQIKVQLLQTMSLLVLNIKRETSLYFLFS